MDYQNNLKKVLIVDDEDMTRVLLTHILQRMRVEGLEVLLAEDGEEAVKDLKIIDAIYLAIKTGKKVDLKL